MIGIELRDGVAIATGGAQGIGFGVAQALRSSGARIVVNDLDEKRATEAAARLGPDAIPLAGDVSDEATAEAIVATACRELGAVDGLVDNAGIGGSARGPSIRRSTPGSGSSTSTSAGRT